MSATFEELIYGVFLGPLSPQHLIVSNENRHSNRRSVHLSLSSYNKVIISCNILIPCAAMHGSYMLHIVSLLRKQQSFHVWKLQWADVCTSLTTLKGAWLLYAITHKTCAHMHYTLYSLMQSFVMACAHAMCSLNPL